MPGGCGGSAFLATYVLLARPVPGLVDLGAPVGLVGVVLAEQLEAVLPALVLPKRAVGARLDVGGLVLPLVHGQLGHAGEVVGRSHGLPDADRLYLESTVGGGADPEVDRLAANGDGPEGGVLALGGRRDPQVGRVVEPDVLEHRRDALDVGGLRGGVDDRSGVAVAEPVREVAAHDNEQKNDDADAVRVQPLLAVVGAARGLHVISLMVC